MKGDYTFYAWNNDQLPTLNLGNKRWGWAEYVTPGQTSDSAIIYAGAGQNILSNGTPVGTVTYQVTGTYVQVTIDFYDDVYVGATHIYFSDTNGLVGAPKTTSPGLFGHTDYSPYDGKVYNFSSTDGEFWLVVHAEVCWFE